MIALIRMISGLVLWAAGFSVLYALHGLGCGLGWSGTRLVLLAAWAVLVAAQALLLAWLARARTTQLDRIAVAIGSVGLAATLVGGVPILAVPSCV